MSSQFENQFHDTTPSAEIIPIDISPEQIHAQIHDLPERLGFHPTPAIIEASGAIIAGINDDTTTEAQLQQAWTEYARISESIVATPEASSHERFSYAKAQIGAIIHKALIFAATNNTTRYLEELDDAQAYAYEEDLDDISELLLIEIENNIDTIPMSSEVLIIKLQGIISNLRRDYLRHLLQNNTSHTPLYLEELDEIDDYTAAVGRYDINELVKAEIASKIDTVAMTPDILVMKVKSVIDSDNRAYLRELIEQGDQLDELLGHIYGMLLEMGEDPDEILAELGITEQS